MDGDELAWNRTLREQMSIGNHQLRARVDGVTDDEYVWSPVPDGWSGRPRGRHRDRVATRHVIVGGLAAGNAAHLGAPAASYQP
jgi:hypothetical protein